MSIQHDRDPVPPAFFEAGAIRLRKPALTDAACLFACGNDPEVALYANWPMGVTLERITSRIEGAAETWDSGEEYRWVIASAADDSPLGAISLFVEGDSAEFGYFVHRDHLGKGHATAAARTVADWAMSEPGIRRLWATCDFENAASIRVLEKAGLSLEGTLPEKVVRPNLSPDPREAVLYSWSRDSSAG